MIDWLNETNEWITWMNELMHEQSNIDGCVDGQAEVWAKLWVHTWTHECIDAMNTWNC